jgi:CubicO group peptidase (beta-lactamase class C family)
MSSLEAWKCLPIGRLSTVFLIFWSLASSLAAEDAPAELSRLFSTCYSNQQFNGVCLVADKDRVLYLEALGYRELEARSPHSKQTLFDLASVSKPITATAVLLLVKDGKLSLTDELVKFFPDWPYKGITVQHLLTHTAGLPEYRNLFTDWKISRPVSNGDVLKRLAELKPPVQFPPGEAWRYSNTGYALLALVVEQVSGLSYADFLRTRIFSPLGMQRSRVLPDPQSDSARGYLLTGRGFQPWSIDRHLDAIIGDGGTWCTAEELFAFARAFFSERLLGDLTKSALSAVRLPGGGYQYNGVGCGLGWQLKFQGDDPTPVAAFHTGNYGGFKTLLWHDLRTHRTCVLLDNLSHSLEDIAAAVQDILAGKPWHALRKSIQETILLAIHKEGINAALEKYRALARGSSAEYIFDERQLNTVGYILLRDKAVDDAIKIFTLNSQEYPQSFNVFDSLAEAYLAKDNVREAIRCYEEAVRLNPGYKDGVDMIQRLRQRL